ncbi:MAG: Ku protein [Planctomycetota bacterium]
MATGMRAMWTGSISFGLVNVPIKMYTAVSSHDVSFHQHHDDDMGRIKYAKVCADCGEVIDAAHIVKATEVGDQTAVVTEDELASLRDEQPKTVEILQFVDQSEVDPLAFESGYYLAPAGPVNGYHLLRQVMQESGRVAICRVMLRSKTSLSLLRVTNENVLTMHTLSWPDEIRTPAFTDLNKPFEVKQQELAVANMLLDSMTGTFEPTEFVDNYHERLIELVSAKASGEAFTPQKQQTPAADDASDLLAQLEASLGKKAPAAKKEPAKRAATKRAPRKAAVA